MYQTKTIAPAELWYAIEEAHAQQFEFQPQEMLKQPFSVKHLYRRVATDERDVCSN